jgi:hypothetical protein
VFLYSLLQNGIFLHSHQDSFLYFHFSRIRHPLFLSFIPTAGPTFLSPSWLLPPPPPRAPRPLPRLLCSLGRRTSPPPVTGILPGSGGGAPALSPTPPRHLVPAVGSSSTEARSPLQAVAQITRASLLPHSQRLQLGEAGPSSP